MSGTTHDQRSGARDRVVLAVILIAVGIGGFALQYLENTPNIGGWVVLMIGLGFLAVFTFTRQYGFLVPGGIMAGLGSGILASEAVTLTDEGTAGTIVLGLGLGFVAIWVIGAIVSVVGHHFWPLIPGGILAAVGAALLVGGQAVDLLDYWPIALIAVGVLVLGRAWMDVRSRE